LFYSRCIPGSMISTPQVLFSLSLFGDVVD